MNPRIAGNGNYNRLIDRALRRIGSAAPPEGMEGRIRARLAGERMKLAASGHSLFSGIPRLAFGAAATAIACFAIVAGSVHHSHRIQPVLPGIAAPPASEGMGAANAVRPADRPVSPSPAGRPRSVRKLPEGRAVISPESQKPAGVAVPKIPAAQR